jgi:hypothetical protein
MGLYKRTGTNPFSSCLPLLLQSPIFFALSDSAAGPDPAARPGEEGGSQEAGDKTSCTCGRRRLMMSGSAKGPRPVRRLGRA